MHPLYIIGRQIKEEKEFKKLIDITFTHKEKKLILERWHIFAECAKGSTQRNIAKNVECSIVTATRGVKAYKENKESIDYYLSLIGKRPPKNEIIHTPSRIRRTKSFRHLY
jgi:Trp operon repressor